MNDYFSVFFRAFSWLFLCALCGSIITAIVGIDFFLFAAAQKLSVKTQNKTLNKTFFISIVLFTPPNKRLALSGKSSYCT